MKAKTVRFLAGGLAATIMMTNMAAMPVFANETITESEAAVEMVVEEAPSAEEIVEQSIEEVQDTEEADQVTEEAAAPAEAAAQATEEVAAPAEAAAPATEEAAASAEEAAQATEEAAASAEEAAQATEEATVPAEEAAQATEEVAAPAEETVQATEEAEQFQLAEEDIASETAIGTEAPTEKEADKTAKTQSEQAGATKADSTEDAKASKAEEAYVPTEEELKLIEEEANKVADSINSIGELMDLLINQDNTKALPEGKDPEREESKAPNVKPGFTKAVISFACGKVLDKYIKMVPGGQYVVDPVKNLVLKMFGLKYDELALQKAIYDRFNETNNKIDELRGETKREIETIGSIRAYGERLDAFTTSSNSLADKIEKIKRDKSLNENQKAVMIASFIGGSDKWTVGSDNIFNQMDYAAQTMRTKSHNGPAADTSSRNMYDLFYDYHKETSVFSGEAMNKADEAIMKRTSDYVLNCGILFEALKAHEKIANFTDDDVKYLDDETREVYKKIKSNKKTIQLTMKSVIETFTGDKESNVEANQIGILDAVKEYYGKDKTIYLEKNGERINEIELSEDLYTMKSENFKLSRLEKKTALTVDQIWKIHNHATQLGMTTIDFLDTVGFNVKALKEAGRIPYLSTLDEKETGHLGLRVRNGTLDHYFMGINMREVGAKETENHYHYYHKGQPFYMFWKIWDPNIKESYDANANVIVFQKK